MRARSPLGMCLLFPCSPFAGQTAGHLPRFQVIFSPRCPSKWLSETCPRRTSSFLPTLDFSYLKLFSTHLSNKLPLLQDASLYLTLLFPLSPS